MPQRVKGIVSHDLDGAGTGVYPIRRTRHEDPIAAAFRLELERGIPKRNPEPAHLLASAAGKDAEHRAFGRDTEPRARGLARGPRLAIDERVPHVLAPKTEVAEEALLEGQHHRQPIDGRGEPAGAARSPGPELRGNVVEDFGSRLACRFSHPEVKSGVIDQDDEVVAAGSEIVPERTEEAEMGASFVTTSTRPKAESPSMG